MRPFQVTRTGEQVFTIDLHADSRRWEQWVLLRSDAHHDNSHCNQELEKRHLDQALEREALICDIGDLYCAMQGKWDKRADDTQFRPELRHANYLDRLVDYNTDFYRPYARNWAILAPGNHETGVFRRHQTDLTERLAKNLHSFRSPAMAASYQGWVRFHFRWQTTKRCAYRMRYTHGYGGGGPVTKDLIQAHRQLAYTESAEIIASGHTHDQVHMLQARQYLNDDGKLCIRKVHCIKIGGYKDEFSGGNGWAVERGHPPKPLGAFWLRFYLEQSLIKLSVHPTDD